MSLVLLPQDTDHFGRTPAVQNGPRIPGAASPRRLSLGCEADDLDEIFGPVDAADLRPVSRPPFRWTPLFRDVRELCVRLCSPEAAYYDEAIVAAAHAVLLAMETSHGVSAVREAFRVVEALRPAIEALPGMERLRWPQ